jgi:hypothetical protein
MNEANNMTFHAYTELASRTKQGVYLDWNPVNEFWFHTDLQNDNDVDFIIVNYTDNEACPESALNFINKAKEKAKTSSYWENWYKVYGLGQIGSLDGVIFNNWQTIDTIPEDARLLGYGVDFGYSNDPTAIVEVYKWNDKRIINEICYQKGLSNSQIAKFIPTKDIVYCDSAEPKSIAELVAYGLNAKGVKKGADSVNFGIQVMQSQSYLVTAQSTNLINELRKYAWDKDKRTGVSLNKPIDMFNHCFTGETLITTINGQIRIDKIKAGDLVLTSKGYKKVLVTFDNGIKEVNNYSMQLDTFFVSLCSTKEHKIKTTKEWKQISKLQKQDKLFLQNYLTEKNTAFIQTKDITVEDVKDYILKYGNTLKAIYQKDIMSITLMELRQIIELKTLILLMKPYILGLQVKKGLKTTQSLLKIFTLKGLKPLNNGMLQKKVKNGIVNMAKNVGLIENTKNVNVKCAEKNLKQDTEVLQNIAIKTAKLKHLDKGESYKAQVYDLMVEDCHEYFANGVLVHNCIDSLRYHEMESIGNPHKGNYSIH